VNKAPTRSSARRLLKAELRSAESIPLLRAQSVVTSLTGAQGKFRETRLTAVLAYLIALAPERFLSVFGFAGDAINVTLEMRHEEGRSDILVETSRGIGVIEAKVTATDATAQARRYGAKWNVLLTQYLASTQQRRQSGFRYITWHELHEACLERLARGPANRARFVANDLVRYLKEHGMVSSNNNDQVYAREINEPLTLNCFLRSRVYFCYYQKGSRLPLMSYFAPYFGKQLARMTPGIRDGISYIAKIVHVEVVDDWHDLQEAIREFGDLSRSRYSSDLAPLRRGWSWTGKRRSLLFLGEPRLAFNPPILKSALMQGGRGRLGRYFYSFDDLFRAWGT
jgi:hypothetical protein